MINIVIIDKWNIYSQGIQGIINLEKDLKVNKIFNDQSDLITGLVRACPDVILFHVQSMQEDSAEKVHNFKAKNPNVKLIYLFSNFEVHMMYQELVDKVDGFLLYNLNPDKFLTVIRDVANGQYVLSGEIAEAIIREMKYSRFSKKEELRARLIDNKVYLTKRELDIIFLLYLDKSNREIANILRLSEKSVRDYISKIYRKLRIKNRKLLVHYLKGMMQQQDFKY